MLYFQNLEIVRPSLVVSLKNYVPHSAEETSEDELTSAWDDVQKQVESVLRWKSIKKIGSCSFCLSQSVFVTINVKKMNNENNSKPTFGSPNIYEIKISCYTESQAYGLHQGSQTQFHTRATF